MRFRSLLSPILALFSVQCGDAATGTNSGQSPADRDASVDAVSQTPDGEADALDAMADHREAGPPVEAGLDAAPDAPPPKPDASNDPAALCGALFDAEQAWLVRCGSPELSSARRDKLRELARSHCALRVVAVGNQERAALAQCAGLYQSATSCDEIPCTLPYGTLAGSKPCGDDSQCASAVCNLEFGEQCGVCDDALPAGADCSDGTSCAAGLICEADRCSPIVEAHLGERCSSDGPICAGYMLCDFSINRCVAAPNRAGARCINGTCGFGLYCTESETCAAVKWASVGAACNDTSLRCEEGACVNGKCQAAGAKGSACGSGKAPCDQYLVCASGRCVVDDPSACK